ncbi:MAG: hypothetical protein K0A93_12685 [Desulfuromonadaceae bacterium]|nr:hypothetical protein [Desulfuromonadaceae bacterium]
MSRQANSLHIAGTGAVVQVARAVRTGIACLGILLLAGCIGGYARYPVECDSDYPLENDIFTRDHWGPLDAIRNLNPSGNPVCKDDFLRDWGKPDEIVTISAAQEKWVYNRSEYCGIVPVYVVPVPLVVPVCDEFDHITFENDRAVHIHFRRVTGSGWSNLGGHHLLRRSSCPDASRVTRGGRVRLPFGGVSIRHTEACRSLVYRDGAIFWTDGSVNQKIDPQTYQLLESIPIAGKPYASLAHARGPGAVWLAAGEGEKPLLSRVNPVTGAVLATIPLPHGVDTIATEADAVWVLGKPTARRTPESAIRLSRIDPVTNQLVATILLDVPFKGRDRIMAVAGDTVWIAPKGDNLVTVIRFNPFPSYEVSTFEVATLDEERPKNYYGILALAATPTTLRVMVFKQEKGGFDQIVWRVALREFSAATSTPGSTTDLGADWASDVLDSAALTLAGEDVWVCLPRGIYVFPSVSVP